MRSRARGRPPTTCHRRRKAFGNRVLSPSAVTCYPRFTESRMVRRQSGTRSSWSQPPCALHSARVQNGWACAFSAGKILLKNSKARQRSQTHSVSATKLHGSPRHLPPKCKHSGVEGDRKEHSKRNIIAFLKNVTKGPETVLQNIFGRGYVFKFFFFRSRLSAWPLPQWMVSAVSSGAGTNMALTPRCPGCRSESGRGRPPLPWRDVL